MTDYLSPVPVDQPIHFFFPFTIAPYQVRFKWSMPLASPALPEVTSTWTNGVAVGLPTVISETTQNFHVDLIPTGTPGPLQWRVEALDSGANFLAVDEGIVNVAASPLRN